MSAEALSTRSIGRVLLSRDYGPLFVGNLVSNSGTWFQNIAQVLLVYRLTGSTLLVGVVNFAQFAPIIFLALPAGRAADRFDRRRLLIVAQSAAAASAALLALLTALGAVNAPVVIAFAVAIGVATAFTTPALQALVPSLVAKDELPSAVALTAVTFNLARALGPVAGVAVVAGYGMAWAFLLNALSYLVLVAALASLRPRPGPVRERGAGELKVGARLVTRDVLILLPIVFVGLVSLTADPVNTLTPEFSTDVLGRPDTFTGFLVGAFGTGAVIAAFVVTRWRPSLRSLAVTLAAQSLGMIAFALSSTEWTALLSLCVSGFGYLASVTTSTSLLHLAIDDSYRGRVMAFWSMSFHGVRPLGSLLDGALAAAAGIRVAAVVLGLPSLVGSATAALFARRRRGAGAARPLRAEAARDAGDPPPRSGA